MVQLLNGKIVHIQYRTIQPCSHESIELFEIDPIYRNFSAKFLLEGKKTHFCNQPSVNEVTRYLSIAVRKKSEWQKIIRRINRSRQGR